MLPACLLLITLTSQKVTYACAFCFCLGVSRPFASDTSPKRIDREGLGKRRTGTRQPLTKSAWEATPKQDIRSSFVEQWSTVVWNPESKTVLDPLTWVEIVNYDPSGRLKVHELKPNTEA